MSNNLQSLSSNDKARIKEVIDAGISILTEVDTLKSGLKDTMAALADELDIKPALLSKALRAAYKQNLAEQREAMTEVEVLLEAAGRG